MLCTLHIDQNSEYPGVVDGAAFTGAGVTAPPIFLWINESTLTYIRDVVSSSGDPSGFL